MVVGNYTITIEPIPNSCKECPFWLPDDYLDLTHHCQFGAIKTFGWCLNRAADCPIINSL